MGKDGGVKYTKIWTKCAGVSAPRPTTFWSDISLHRSVTTNGVTADDTAFE